MATNKRDIFQGRIVSLGIEEHALPDGRVADFEIVRHPGGAAVLPLLADGRIVLIRQYRPAGGGMVWEIPAGRLEPGEPPSDCVARELQEEVGYRAGQIEKLGEMLTAVGFCDEVVHLFLARELSPVPRELEPDEYIEVRPMPVAEALQMLAAGAIPDGKTQLALLLARQRGLL
ncbi:ADP-ribose pyrophosphatase [Desulfuromonas versatilis]|uniref:GDP-mannose pyrophosphatase n=1 Tax=Desulfuromonas versatilis TaxID=2802975 RepID=A0ABN6E492_9BACT|nr:NUDIX hydrolase [Desulfuromonas versatilis]BCR06349.1 ADP-ribose pyrophosphatase [Desulfuromonas versatilis]